MHQLLTDLGCLETHQKKTAMCSSFQQPKNLKKKLLLSTKHHIALWKALLACGVRAVLTWACRFAMGNTTYKQNKILISKKTLTKNSTSQPCHQRTLQQGHMSGLPLLP